MSIDAPDWSTIPAPQDDGDVRHLAGAKLPLILLVATDGSTVDLLNLRGRTVVYAYPRTGRPGIQYEPVESQIVADDSCSDARRAHQSCIEMQERVFHREWYLQDQEY